MPELERLPYKAINVYMEEDYLESLLKNLLLGLKKAPKADQISFSKFLKQEVNVLGFRDPTRAPLTLQVRALATAFEQKEEVIPVTLNAWVKLNDELAKSVKAWLEAEGWKDLALERDYDESGGFVADWPKKLSFEKLVKKYEKDHPDDKVDRDDLILMVLWISGQLPKDQAEI